MGAISELVRKAIDTGCLTVETEDQLRQLLQMTKYGRDDLDAFVNLNHAVREGQVRQESRELFKLECLKS